MCGQLLPRENFTKVIGVVSTHHKHSVCVHSKFALFGLKKSTKKASANLKCQQKLTVMAGLKRPYWDKTNSDSILNLLCSHRVALKKSLVLNWRDHRFQKQANRPQKGVKIHVQRKKGHAICLLQFFCCSLVLIECCWILTKTLLKPIKLELKVLSFPSIAKCIKM